MRSSVLLPATLVAFVLVENAIFNSGRYARIVKLDSSAGNVEQILWNEKSRARDHRPQVVAVGDSRMGFFVRYADQTKPALEEQFATIAVPGSTPRDWYYLLRDIDPRANRYAAILIPMDDYDDAETLENRADRETDLHYLIAVLHWRDLFEFPESYQSRELKFRAALGILLKGTVYKADFQDLLLNVPERLRLADLARNYSAQWFYNYVGSSDSLAGTKVDWAKKTVTVPPGVSPDKEAMVRSRLFDPRPPDEHRASEYLHHWLGKIEQRYRGSRTRLIFFRLPRGPFVRPDPPPFNAHSSVRDLAKNANVIVENEDDFDFLERPEFFLEALHMNAAGCAEFSRALAAHVQELLDAHAL
ncbi:MAG TPA: hypothetical protein VMB85_12050 [Bryobacteraceae bacterium]|nr:hypothetical protein [Bryobacteraceae bacterium]